MAANTNVPTLDPQSNLGPSIFYPANPAERLYRLPWPAGITRRVADCPFNRPHYSDHKGYEWDWPMQPGEPVLAARSGKVIFVGDSVIKVMRQDGDVITVDWYIHIQTENIPVSVDMEVQQGQLLTYLASGMDHLHFEVHVKKHSGVGHNGRFIQSVPVAFVEMLAREDGVPWQGDPCLSQNGQKL